VSQAADLIADTACSNRLAVLAAEIREAHDDVGRSNKYSAERAVDAGRSLAEAKKDPNLPRGGWRRWVENAACVPLSTADHYVALFRAEAKGLLTLGDIAEAGQVGALKAVAEKIKQSEPPEPEPSHEWTPDQLDRRARAEAGECVVANMHEDTDAALLAWAEASDRFVRIDRKTEWGNPFEMPDDGDRDAVVGKFERFYFPQKDSLLTKTEGLSGKVLGCWCHPERCHGHIIAEAVNREANGEDIWSIAQDFAEREG
jgi:hypothetical protein